MPIRDGTSSSKAGGLDAPVASEADEYGIGHFVYRSRWPFHPERLHDAFDTASWDGVLHSKGFYWVSSWPDFQGLWQQAGADIVLEQAAPLFAVIPRDEWELEPEDLADLEQRWDPLLGDQMTELVFIGIDLLRSRPTVEA